eukprot:11222957-Alexandrium_andersonii.AAC.1
MSAAPCTARSRPGVAAVQLARSGCRCALRDLACPGPLEPCASRASCQSCEPLVRCADRGL